MNAVVVPDEPSFHEHVETSAKGRFPLQRGDPAAVVRSVIHVNVELSGGRGLSLRPETASDVGDVRPYLIRQGASAFWRIFAFR